MKPIKLYLFILLSFGLIAFNNSILSAHCDTKNGPVITAAEEALDKGDVNLVLIWVQPKDEAEIIALFNKTLKIRKTNAEVQELADNYFFENLVRIHRAGEGAPYTGLKETGEVELPIAIADKAIETGDVKEVTKLLNTSMEKGIKEKFNHLVALKNFDKDNVTAGREYVEAYVVFIHYVEGIYNTLEASEVHHAENLHAEGNKKIEKEIEISHSVHSEPASSNHLTHLLIIIGTILVIFVQIVTSRKKN